MEKLVLVAVDVRSAHNVGSFFRTCDGFGAGLILSGISPRPVGDTKDERLPHVIQKADKEIAKTALGAETKVNWSYFVHFRDVIEYLRKLDYCVFAIEQSKSSMPISALNGSQYKKIALIVGTEVTGLPEKYLGLCDKTFEIPMSGRKESFNVSVAAAIALYQAKL